MFEEFVGYFTGPAMGLRRPRGLVHSAPKSVSFKSTHFSSQGGSGAASSARRYSMRNGARLTSSEARMSGLGAAAPSEDRLASHHLIAYSQHRHHQRHHNTGATGVGPLMASRRASAAAAANAAPGLLPSNLDQNSGRHNHIHRENQFDSTVALFDATTTTTQWPVTDQNASASSLFDSYSEAVADGAFAIQDYGISQDVDDFLPQNETAVAALSLLDGLTDANNIKLAAVALCALLGALCILLNAFVIASLLANRRRVLTNVFYVLVLHCALVDLIRGGCLVAYGLPHFLILNTTTMEPRLFALKINQFTLMILRSCNLLTIFNLLVFTTNEFIVIRYPLHYRRYFLRKTVLVILALSWLVSVLFGVGSALSNFVHSAHSLIVFRASTQSRRRDDGVGIGDADPVVMMMKRRETGDLPLNVICMLTSFFLCYVCLIIVLICYGTILNTIRNFHNTEKRSATTGSGKSVRHDGSSAVGGGGGGGTQRSASLYQKRYHHDALKKSTTASSSPVTRPPSSTSYYQCHYHAHQPLSTRISNSTAYSVQGVAPGAGGSGSAASTPKSSVHCAEDGASTATCNAAANAAADVNTNRRCNSHRKWKSHLMSRHKYLIVIGTVLFVDILFLLPYSAIQMVAIIHLHRMMAASTQSTLIRWGLQILIGVHSVCQPLCYFRMNEFRRLACCGAGGRVGSRRSAGSGSSANAAGGGGGTSASRKRRGFFSRSKSMSHSRDPRTETETYALQSTTSVGNLTRVNGKPTTRQSPGGGVDSALQRVDSSAARRRLYKQHKTSKASSISSSFGSKMSALRRISSSSLVLQSTCLVTVNVEDVDGDAPADGAGDEPALVDGVYDYGAARHVVRIREDDELDPDHACSADCNGAVLLEGEDGSSSYRFHSIDTIPSVSNENSSHSADLSNGDIAGAKSPNNNGGVAQVIEVDARLKRMPPAPRRERSQSTTLAAAASGIAHTLRRALTFRRASRRRRRAADSDDEDREGAREVNRLILEEYPADVNGAWEDDGYAPPSRFRRYGAQAQADFLSADSRNARLSTLSDMRSSFSDSAVE